MFGIAFCLVEILYADKMLLAENKELSFCHRTMFTIKKNKFLPMLMSSMGFCNLSLFLIKRQLKILFSCFCQEFTVTDLFTSNSKHCVNGITISNPF